MVARLSGGDRLSAVLRSKRWTGRMVLSDLGDPSSPKSGCRCIYRCGSGHGYRFKYGCFCRLGRPFKGFRGTSEEPIDPRFEAFGSFRKLGTPSGRCPYTRKPHYFGVYLRAPCFWKLPFVAQNYHIKGMAVDGYWIIGPSAVCTAPVRLPSLRRRCRHLSLA